MTNKVNEQPIENAGAVIEKFGGIRPMSTKTGVAVTTIQGWKKRDVIPANRVADIVAAAVKHDVDLSGLVAGVAAPVVQPETKPDVVSEAEAKIAAQVPETEKTEDTKPVEEDAPATIEAAPTEEAQPKEAQAQNADASPQKPAEDILAIKKKSPNAPANDYTELVIETEKRGVAKGALMAASVILVILIAAIAMLMPKIQKHEGRVAELEQELNQMQKQQTVFKGLVPENWSEQLTQLKKELEFAKSAAQSTVAPAVDSIKSLSDDLAARDPMAIQKRVDNLQTYVNEVTQSTSLAELYSRIESLRMDAAGRKDLMQAVAELRGLFAGIPEEEAKDPERMNGLLAQAVEQKDALGQTLADVPSDDLKAAAMLLALNQMRSSLNRSGQPFDEDLELLMKMTGDDNQDLRASLERLAPHAESGVLSTQGLSNEFRTLAGEAVVASLKGEDVSLMEKAQARMNDLLAVEKEGELISGTPTQAVVNKAQKQVDEGQIAEALSLLKSKLGSKELAPLSPWISKAEAFLDAQVADSMMSRAIELNTGSGYLGGSQLLTIDEIPRP